MPPGDGAIQPLGAKATPMLNLGITFKELSMCFD